MKKQLNEKHIYKGLKLIPKFLHLEVYELTTVYGKIYTTAKPEIKNDGAVLCFPLGTKFYTTKFCSHRYETKVLLYKTYETLVKKLNVKIEGSKKPKRIKRIKK